MNLGVTVVVCTYNGAALLPETLRHVAQQRVHPDIPWEVIVVDNASTDNTSSVVIEEWEKYKSSVPFKLLHQPKQGLTYARELALESSRFEFILFCDDDNWLNPEYVNLVYDLMLQHSYIGVLGGHGELVYETTPPSWASTLSLFGNGPQSSNSSGKVMRNAVYGAGCTLRQSAYKAINAAGFKPMLTDRVASSLSSGGDYEMCYGIALAGYDIWYDERLRFKHFMPNGRINWDYYVRYFKEGTQCHEVLIPYQILLNFGCKDTLTFNFILFRIFIRHIVKLIPVLLKKVKLSAGTEEAALNSLMLMALKGRLVSFTRYSTIRRNFNTILNFKQEKLALPSAIQYSRKVYSVS